MTVRIISAQDLYWSARRHLDGAPERVGFFLADWSPANHSFMLRVWRAISETDLEFAERFHVSLPDEIQTEVISWAWSEGRCLIEAHSHGGGHPAQFSLTDLEGFEEWVPHLWWRLRRRPYAAVVTSDATLDGLAWITGGCPVRR